MQSRRSLLPDERRRGFYRVAGAAARAYKALLPDERAALFLKPVATLHVLAEALRGKLGPVDISAVSAKIEALLDEKIEGVAITAPIIEGDEPAGRVDLSSIDFEKLALTLFAGRPKTAAEKLGDGGGEKGTRDGRTPTRPACISCRSWRSSSRAYNLGTPGPGGGVLRGAQGVSCRDGRRGAARRPRGPDGAGTRRLQPAHQARAETHQGAGTSKSNVWRESCS